MTVKLSQVLITLKKSEAGHSSLRFHFYSLCLHLRPLIPVEVSFFQVLIAVMEQFYGTFIWGKILSHYLAHWEMKKSLSSYNVLQPTIIFLHKLPSLLMIRFEFISGMVVQLFIIYLNGIT